MKQITAAGILAILLSVLLTTIYFSIPTGPLTVRAQTPATVGIWSSVYGRNIEDVNLTPDTTFDVKVNITGAGPIIGYDVFLAYDYVALGPPCEPDTQRCVLDAVQGSFFGALIDPANPPTPCQVLLSKFEVAQPIQAKGNIRVAATFIGPCSVDGNGILFSITFQVRLAGATNIVVVETDGSGSALTKIVGAGAVSLPYEAQDAYFRNKAGTSPVADFTFNPLNPVRGDQVAFDASSSFDPSNSTKGPDKGIKRYVWSFGDNTANGQGPLPSHVFVVPVSNPTTGNFSVTLVVWTYDSDLPRGITRVVEVGEGTVHNVLVSSPTLDKSVVTAGETVGVRLTIFNRGTIADTVSLQVSFDYKGTTVVGNETGVVLDVDGSRQFSYSIQTADLPPEVYTVTATVVIRNPSGGTIPDAQPSDNTRTNTFEVTRTDGRTSQLSIPLLLGGAVAVLVVGGAVVYLLRRRTVRKE